MTATLFVGMASVALFIYWFRYTSLLILSTKTSFDFSYDIARAHELLFHETRAALADASILRFDTLLSGIDHDYRLVSALLRTVGCGEQRTCLEDFILRIDFAGLKLAYYLSRPFSESVARKALTEMADVVAHFANAVGERSMAANAAV